MVPGARPGADDAAELPVHDRGAHPARPWRPRGRGYSERTARDARSTLTTDLGDAIPQHLQVNPAQRNRGKGRKGRRRIELHERAEKAWPTPFQALLIAERCAALSGSDTDFVMIIATAWTGMRWGEAIGLRPECVRGETLGIEWKLYELGGRFYRG